MNTLTIKIPEAMALAIEQASQREHLTKSEWVRRALAARVARPGAGPAFVSALEQAGNLVGCFEGGPGDLATNQKHLRDFGRK